MPKPKTEKFRCGIYRCKTCGYKKYLEDTPWAYCPQCDLADKFNLITAIKLEIVEPIEKKEACDKLKKALQKKGIIK